MRARRWIFGAEVVVIVVPYALLIGALVFSFVRPQFGAVDVLIAVAISAAIFFPFICGVRLAVAYLLGGAPKLCEVRTWWWWGAYLGALVPIVGAAAWLLRWGFGDFPIEPPAPEQPFGPARIGLLVPGVIAAPLLLPLGHLRYERSRAAAL